ncbi:hypothetical protein PGT21_018917 [Puccinia graminis f. sp. tritici]|uniref:Uncharacterized protein n=1 Tax=Puccinia graminis f. sp. tritici TaxID=56615 RepID=A0A5B0LQA6_PUCGR|nr:hypothetical protein PGT21_018917 [Puccinia graminis f. sp. tritici]KAA1130329.1 hypothetical protein PGTUg99_017049 [Puccinia graminis f. sp. tritici]
MLFQGCEKIEGPLQRGPAGVYTLHVPQMRRSQEDVQPEVLSPAYNLIFAASEMELLNSDNDKWISYKARLNTITGGNLFELIGLEVRISARRPPAYAFPVSHAPIISGIGSVACVMPLVMAVMTDSRIVS